MAAEHSDQTKSSRIRGACKSCSESKVRCDNSVPVCTRCKRRRLKCLRPVHGKTGVYEERVVNENIGAVKPNEWEDNNSASAPQLGYLLDFPNQQFEPT